MKIQKISSRNLDFLVKSPLQLQRSTDRKIYLKSGFPENKIIRIDENTETSVLETPVTMFVPLKNEEFLILDDKRSSVTYWADRIQKSEILQIRLKKSFDLGLFILALLLTLLSVIALYDLYVTQQYPISSPFREIITILLILATILALFKSYRPINGVIFSGDKLNEDFYVSRDHFVLLLSQKEGIRREKELDAPVISLRILKNIDGVKILARTEKSLYLLSNNLDLLWQFSVKGYNWTPHIRLLKHKNAGNSTDLIITDGKNLLIFGLDGVPKYHIPILPGISKKEITLDTGDVDGDGEEEIIVSDSSQISVIKKKEIIASYNLPKYITAQLAVTDLDNDYVSEIIACYGSHLEVFKLM